MRPAAKAALHFFVVILMDRVEWQWLTDLRYGVMLTHFTIDNVYKKQIAQRTSLMRELKREKKITTVVQADDQDISVKSTNG